MMKNRKRTGMMKRAGAAVLAVRPDSLRRHGEGMEDGVFLYGLEY